MFAQSPFRIVLLFVVWAGVGFALLPLVAVELNPRPALPVLTVSYTLPQSSPEVVEAQASAPLENVFSQLRELKKITSVSRYDGGSITLYFDKHTDLNFRRFEVASLIRRTYPTLPKSLTYPQIKQGTERKRQALPLLSYSINAPYTPTQIKQTIENQLQKQLLLIEGISQVEVRGATDRQVAIAYNAEKLAQYQLSPQDIEQTIRQYNTQTHLGGHLTPAGERLYFKTDQTIKNLQDLRSLALRTLESETGSRQVIRLQEVAEVYWEEQRIMQHFRINGQNAITLNLYAHEGANQLNLVATVQHKLQTLQQALPAGFQLLLEHNDTEHIQTELQKIYYRSGLSMLILLGLLWVLYRRVRYLWVLMSSLFVTLGLTCFCIYGLGLTLHLYSLAGLTLSFGLVMDNAIMMLAHLRQYRNTKILRALLGATLCTVVALSLVFGLPEEERLNLTDFAVVVILNLVMSLVVAVWFTPAVYALFEPRLPALAQEVGYKEGFFFRIYRKGITSLRRFRILFYGFLLLMFGLPVFALPTKIEGWTWYNDTLGNEWYTENIRPTIDKWLGGALRLFVQEVYEKAGYREAEKTQLFAQVRMPQGTTLDHINNLVKEVENLVGESEGLEKYVAYVHSEQSASITITFSKKGEQQGVPYQLKQILVSQSIDKAGAEWNIYGVGEGFSSGGGDKIPSFRVEMRGYNYIALEKQAQILAQKLMKHKRIQTVNTNERLDFSERASQEWILRPYNRVKETASLSNASVVNATQLYTEVSYPQMQLLMDNTLTPVLLQNEQAHTYNLQSLWLNGIQTQQNGLVRLADFGRIDTVKTTNTLHRENRQYIRVVGFEYFGSAKFGEEYLDKMLAEMQETMPVGYTTKKLSYRFGDWDKLQRQYGLVAILAVAIFLIGGILFESLRQPFWIILNIPIAFVGLFLTFAWFGFYFDQGGYAAFFLLGGLVVNASIYIVNDYNNLPTHEKQEGVLYAVRHKAVPILLTLFSNVLGLLPFLSEGDSEVFWFSLAVGTIGGLVFSVLAIFVVLPVVMLSAKTKV